MDPRDTLGMVAAQANGGALSERYRITITLDVTDANALWDAALSRGMLSPGSTFADLVDTIGPREDPTIADCLAMLAMPGDLRGCAVDDFTIDPALPRTIVERVQPWARLSSAVR